MAAAGLLTGVGALGAPAAADTPEEFTDVSVFEEPDPCNPDVIQTTTLTFDVHDHRNNTVVVLDFTAEKDIGYSGTGRNTVVTAENHFTDTQTAICDSR